MKSWTCVALWILLIQFASFPPSESYDRKLQKGKIRLHLSARNVDRGKFEKSDPYCLVSLSEDGGRTTREIGQTEKVKDDSNPDWETEFEVDFIREHQQYFYFVVKDADAWNGDDALGRVWVSVADYVDKGEFDKPRLTNKGYLIMEGVNPEQPKHIAGRLPIPTNVSEWLRFRVFTRNQPTDDVNAIPLQNKPYVEVAYVDNPDGTPHKIGRTDMRRSSTAPRWDGVFAFHWNKKGPGLHPSFYFHFILLKLLD
ncbi:Copine-5 [Orchesella cincta]|uniref:Copine-5 n=1 Tax=Orchesella cincta TaxID=48709 RepID=A0A1D2M5F4_ORCCI|nr:Copine-5 [Orchesella cincta]